LKKPAETPSLFAAPLSVRVSAGGFGSGARSRDSMAAPRRASSTISACERLPTSLAVDPESPDDPGPVASLSRCSANYCSIGRPSPRHPPPVGNQPVPPSGWGWGCSSLVGSVIRPSAHRETPSSDLGGLVGRPSTPTAAWPFRFIGVCLCRRRCGLTCRCRPRGVVDLAVLDNHRPRRTRRCGRRKTDAAVWDRRSRGGNVEAMLSP
jgi:hypothetical protein